MHPHVAYYYCFTHPHKNSKMMEVHNASSIIMIYMMFDWCLTSSYSKTSVFIRPHVNKKLAWETTPNKNMLAQQVNVSTEINLAGARCSDSGEQCKVKRSAKKWKRGRRRGERGNTFPHLSPQSPSTFHRFLYFAPLSTIWMLGTG